MAGSDFSAPCITGYGSSPSRCGPATAARRSGQTRDLPGSDTIPLHVMWPLTPAGRQHLAERCRTCCLRANENPRPLRNLIFRGSIPHPMQSLCTLRNHCHQGSRNTRYQAGAAPYLRRTSTGWIAPACLAHSFDDLVGERKQRLRKVEAERVCGFEVNHEFELGGLIDWNISWFNAAEDLVHVIGDLSRSFGIVGPIGHQSTKIRVEAPGINCRQPLFCRELNNTGAKPGGNDDCIRHLLDQSN